MSKDKIEKGRSILRMKMQSSGKHLERQDLDLMKVPLEALHCMALQQIGEQESYIEELEARLNELTEKVTLTRKDNVRIAEEARKEKVIADIWNRFLKSQKKYGTLLKKYREMSTKYSYCMLRLSELKEKLKQYEQ